MKFARHAGSAMLFALLLLALAGVLTAAWLTLMTSRAGYVEQTAAAVQRRIARENSRSLAQEFLLERVLPSTAGVAFSYDLADSAWGGIRVPAWNAAPMRSTQLAAGVNAFNPGNGDGYTLDLAVTLMGGDTNSARRFSVKSRSPLLAGNLLTSQTPTYTTGGISLGALAVNGSAYVWAPGVGMNFIASAYELPGGVTPVLLASRAPSNFAAPRQVANPRASAAFYGGQFDVVANADPAANSLAEKAVGGAVVQATTPLSAPGVTCDGAGNVVITLDTPDLANVTVTGDLVSLTLAGQPGINDATADDYPAILVVVQPGNAFASLTVSGHNSRRVALAIKKAGGATVGAQFTTANAAWRLLLELENTPVTLAGSATLTGGIRSDRSVTLGAGSVVVLAPETDPKLLERLASRTAWVESFVP